MKPQILSVAATAAVIMLGVPSARAQGELNPPPGPPGPIMKTLAQIEPRTPIGALPFAITAPGSYYLTGNLVGAADEDGITVEANDVTIDLGGFVMAGVPGSKDGIVVSVAHANLMVSNGTIRDWGGDGVNAAEATGGRYQQLRVADNGGAGLRTGERSAVTACVATGNDAGGIHGAFHALISDCVAAGNDQVGISGDAGATIHDCVANNNFGSGIIAFDATVIEGCTSRDNGGNGFFAGAGSVVVRCAATANGGGNGVQTGEFCTVKECSAKNNGNAGVSVDSGSTVRDCVSRQNDGEGILATKRCVLLDNNCSDHAGVGIRLVGSDNRVEGNHLTNNGTGVQVDSGGTMNFIVRNTSRGETSGPGFLLPAEPNTCPISSFGGIGSAGPWTNFSDSNN